MVEIMKRIKWHNGETTEGATATDLLKQLLHGWNPDTVPELKIVLAKRGQVAPPTAQENDEEFLRRLHANGMLVYHSDDQF
jgi:hypothetical protein